MKASPWKNRRKAMQELVNRSDPERIQSSGLLTRNKVQLISLLGHSEGGEILKDWLDGQCKFWNQRLLVSPPDDAGTIAVAQASIAAYGSMRRLLGIQLPVQEEELLNEFTEEIDD
jgi:hypothetical protein